MKESKVSKKNIIKGVAIGIGVLLLVAFIAAIIKFALSYDIVNEDNDHPTEDIIDEKKEALIFNSWEENKQDYGDYNLIEFVNNTSVENYPRRDFDKEYFELGQNKQLHEGVYQYSFSINNGKVTVKNQKTSKSYTIKKINNASGLEYLRGGKYLFLNILTEDGKLYIFKDRLEDIDELNVFDSKLHQVETDYVITEVGSGDSLHPYSDNSYAMIAKTSTGEELYIDMLSDDYTAKILGEKFYYTYRTHFDPSHYILINYDRSVSIDKQDQIVVDENNNIIYAKYILNETGSYEYKDAIYLIDHQGYIYELTDKNNTVAIKMTDAKLQYYAFKDNERDHYYKDYLLIFDDGTYAELKKQSLEFGFEEEEFDYVTMP